MIKKFEYKKIKYRFISKWINKWHNGYFIKKNFFLINEGSTSLNYSQQCFEGIKCFLLNKKRFFFRLEKNSFRFQKSCKKMMMPIVSNFFFICISKILSILNYSYIPCFKKGFLYMRPLLIGIGSNIGVKTSKKFLFLYFCIPVKYNINFNMFIKTLFLNRTINNIGHYKLGGNYILNLEKNFLVKKYNYNDFIYVGKFFEEFSTSNIICYKKNQICSPKNFNILPGINKNSIVYFFSKFKKINFKLNFNIFNNFKKTFASGTAICFNGIKSLHFFNKILKYGKNFVLDFIKKILVKIKKNFFNFINWFI